MARTIKDVLRRARHILQDVEEPRRYSDALLLQHFDSAVLEARRVRPDLFTARLTATPDYSDVDLETAAFPLPDQFLPPFVAYVAGMADMAEEEYVSEGRAQALLGRFAAQLGGTP